MVARIVLVSMLVLVGTAAARPRTITPREVFVAKCIQACGFYRYRVDSNRGPYVSGLDRQRLKECVRRGAEITADGYVPMCDQYVCRDATVGYHLPKGTVTTTTLPPWTPPVQYRVAKPRRPTPAQKAAARATFRSQCILACSHTGTPSRRQIHECERAAIPASWPTVIPACRAYLCPELCQFYDCLLWPGYFSGSGAFLH